MAHTDRSSSVSVLPEPGDAGAFATTPAGADDLIARMADRQIDDLLAAEMADPEGAEAAQEVAAQAASELRGLSESLRSVAGQDIEHDVAPEAVTVVDEPVAGHAVPPAAPNFNPPPPATFADEVISATENPAAEHPATDAQDEHSDADAVARELAADVALLSQPLPETSADAATVDARDPWWRRPLDALRSAPWWVLATINRPARPLSDRGREVMGGIAIVTLVNAIGAIAYLRFFAPRH